MSGDDFSPWTMVQPEQDPEDYTKQVAWWVGCPTGNIPNMKDCMKTRDAQDLADAWIDCTVCFYYYDRLLYLYQVPAQKILLL